MSLGVNFQMVLLTKSKYLTGLQCPRLLWVVFNQKNTLPEFDFGTLHTFKQGHLVGELAKELFSKGIDIPIMPFVENIKKTKTLLKKRKTLFEAGFKAENLFARVDILKPVKKNEWDLIEVKSSTSVKNENIQDVSFQKLVLEKNGLKIRKCYLLHVNNKFVKNGKIEPKKFFSQTDISKEVKEIEKNIEERINEMFKIIALKKIPKTKIGQHCKTPYECPLKQNCWSFLPKNNVTNLYRMGKKSFELINEGIFAIKKIQIEQKLSTKQLIQLNCEKTKKTHANKTKIKEFLKTLKYPFYFLDFETFNTAIPIYNKTKPYQQIPFQFSLHVIDSKNAKPKHYSFLANSSKKIRENFLKELKKVLGNKGSIIVFNESFEKMILKQLGEFLPKETKWVNSTLNRIVDLLIVFRNFDYYNQKQEGSASIKKVLPAMTGKNYDKMNIADGQTASLEFLYTIHGELFNKKPTQKEIAKTRKDLEKYCKMDTLAEVLILEELEKVVE